MCNSAYVPVTCRIYFVSESDSQPKYENLRMRYEWTDQELASIRAVLQKLTAARVLNPNDAEDLVQDTLLTMIMKHPGKKPEKGNLVWGMGILRKKVGNYYRRTQRNVPLGTMGICSRQSPISSSPEAKVFHEELQKVIRQALPQLSSSQRKAMELLIAGFEPWEIVKRLHPERYQNVINHLHRGRKKLAKELARHGYGPQAGNRMRKMKRCGHRMQNSSKQTKGA